MIRHIVFFTVSDPAHFQAVHDGLCLLKDNPHASLLEVGVNTKTDGLSKEIDFVVYGEFADDDALAAYKAHPTYQRSIEIVRPLRETRIAADYVSDAAPARAAGASAGKASGGQSEAA